MYYCVFVTTTDDRLLMGEDKGRWKDLGRSEPRGERPPSKQPIAAPSRAPSVSQCDNTKRYHPGTRGGEG